MRVTETAISSPQAVHTGPNAILVLLEDAEKKSKKELLDRSDVLPFETFSWLVPEDKKDSVVALQSKLKKDIKVVSSRAASSKGQAPASSSKASSSKHKPDAEMQAALSMFS